MRPSGPSKDAKSRRFFALEHGRLLPRHSFPVGLHRGAFERRLRRAPRLRSREGEVRATAGVPGSMALLSAVWDYPDLRVGCFFFVGLIAFATLHAILGPTGSVFAGMGAILAILFVHVYVAENDRKERASWQRIADEFGLNLASSQRAQCSPRLLLPFTACVTFVRLRSPLSSAISRRRAAISCACSCSEATAMLV
jgi:hypothetical protein